MKSVHKSKSAKQLGEAYDHLCLPLDMIHSDEWNALSAGAIKLLIEIAGQYNGRNNGDLTIKCRGFGSPDPRNEHLEELWPTFIVGTRKDAFDTGGSFAIMWKPIDKMNDIEDIYGDECMFRIVFKGDYEGDELESDAESGADRGVQTDDDDTPF